MQNIRVNGKGLSKDHLNEEVTLHNGSLVLIRAGGQYMNAFIVTSFRDHHGKYDKGSTAQYCSLVDLDTGAIFFEERCSRKTTKRRVLRHYLRLGYSKPYNPNDTSEDYRLSYYNMEVYDKGTYEINITK